MLQKTCWISNWNGGDLQQSFSAGSANTWQSLTSLNWSRVVCSNSIFSGCLVKGSKKALLMPKFAMNACSFFFRNISLMELKSAKTKLVEQWVPIQEGCWRLCPWCQEWHRAGWLDLESESPWLYFSSAVNFPSCVHPWQCPAMTHQVTQGHRYPVSIFVQDERVPKFDVSNILTEIMVVSSKLAYIVAPGEAQKESKQAWRTDWTDTLEQWCSSKWLMKAKKIEASSMLKALANDWVIKLREALA